MIYNGKEFIPTETYQDVTQEQQLDRLLKDELGITLDLLKEMLREHYPEVLV